MTDYHPIDCDRHSILELLAMRRTRVVLDGVDADAAPMHLAGVVTDVVTRDGAEYLVLENAAGAHPVRLDRVRALRDGSGAGIWRQQYDDRD